MGQYIGPFEITGSYPTSVDEGTTVVIIRDWHECLISRVAPSILTEIRYYGLY